LKSKNQAATSMQTLDYPAIEYFCRNTDTGDAAARLARYFGRKKENQLCVPIVHDLIQALFALYPTNQREKFSDHIHIHYNHRLPMIGCYRMLLKPKEVAMHISLTPLLESKIKAKVETGLYNNSSEVIREALRFMEENQDIIRQIKLAHLRQAVSIGATQAENGEFSQRSIHDIVTELNQAA